MNFLRRRAPTDTADTARLDHLDALPVPPGFGWKVRPSSTGRGWRLCTTSQHPNYQTAREAIDAHMRQSPPSTAREES